MAAQVKLNSGVFVEIDIDKDMGCVTIKTPLIDEQISPVEAQAIALALNTVADELNS